ncbi:MAG: tetratricopeptide repeat protein [Thermoplasmata archaeon]
MALKSLQFPTTVYKVVQPWEPREAEGRAAESGRGRHLAVLPLTNISPDPNDECFADGLTEELISVLSQVRDLSVIARTSVAPYKSASKSIAQIGAELGVDTVLEGSVRKAGKRIRITLQLVDVTTQGHIWASAYNREIDDVFAVQTDIADRTAVALRLELAKLTGSGALRKPTANPVAYDLYLRGLVAARKSAQNGMEEAVGCFEQATRLDPNFAEAYAAWANLYVALAGDHVSMQEVMPRARELAGRALQLDPESSEAHATLANIALQFDHDWPRAEAEFQTAIALNPNNVTAHRYYGLLLNSLERFDEAKEVLRRAIRLDPGGGHQRPLAWCELLSGNFEPAIRYVEEERDQNPSSVLAHVYLGLFYLAAGRREDALKEAETPLAGASYLERFDHALLNALVERPDEARAVLEEAERGAAGSYNSSTDLAMLYSAIGEKERALTLLEKDLKGGDQVLWLYYRGQCFDPIRNDPRFLSLLRQYGVPSQPQRLPTPSGAAVDGPGPG